MPDEVATLTTLATGAGQTLQSRGGCAGAYVVAGSFSGAQALATAGNWYTISSGDMLPDGVSIRSDGTFAGSLQMRWFFLDSPDDLLAVAALAGTIKGSLNISGPFPAATALADNDPNPTTTRVGANLLGWDASGSDWDRIRSVSNGSMRVLPGTNTLENAMSDSNSDAESVNSVGLYAQAVLRGLRDGGGGLDRARFGVGNVDNISSPTIGLLHTRGFSNAFNNRTLAWERMRQADAYSDARAFATSADSSTIGVKLSLTCPAGATIRVRAATMYRDGGVGNVTSVLTFTPSGGAASAIGAYVSAIATNNSPDQGIELRMTAGDVLEWEVTVALAGSTTTYSFHYEVTRYPI